MTIILFQKGATSWGFQIGKYYLYIPYWSFLKAGCKFKFGIEK